MIGLTPRQLEALTFIERHIATRGSSPTYEEIRAGIGLASKSGVFRLVNGLEKRGRISRLPGLACSISVIRNSEAA